MRCRAHKSGRAQLAQPSPASIAMLAQNVTSGPLPSRKTRRALLHAHTLHIKSRSMRRQYACHTYRTAVDQPIADEHWSQSPSAGCRALRRCRHTVEVQIMFPTTHHSLRQPHSGTPGCPSSCRRRCPAAAAPSSVSCRPAGRARRRPIRTAPPCSCTSRSPSAESTTAGAAPRAPVKGRHAMAE